MGDYIYDIWFLFKTEKNWRWYNSSWRISQIRKYCKKFNCRKLCSEYWTKIIIQFNPKWISKIRKYWTKIIIQFNTKFKISVWKSYLIELCQIQKNISTEYNKRIIHKINKKNYNNPRFISYIVEYMWFNYHENQKFENKILKFKQCWWNHKIFLLWITRKCSDNIWIS